jgi:glyoxylase-like metal-dependent hydrolase (beta-lactamase superfamily II)
LCYSHLHWDHVGDAAPFSSAKIVIGAPAKAELETDVYPKNPAGTITAFPEGREFLYLDYTQRAITPFATFERAIDFYGDGSLYIVDTPGHYPGHLSLVARVAQNAFVFLAGDLCHHRQCYSPGDRLISEFNYMDIATARDSARRLAAFNKDCDNAIVVLAHESQRLEDGMPLFPHDVREWILEQIEMRRTSKS